MSVARTTALWLAAAALALAPAAAAAPETWPARPVKIVVPFTVGSTTDLIGRAVAEQLTAALGQPFVVENRTGSGGTVGASAVARSNADGYTILVNSSAQAISPAIHETLPYDTFRDFVNITPLAELANVLITAPAKGHRSVRDLVGVAKARPGQLSWASAGAGSGTHLSGAKFRMAAGIDALHIPYKGAPEANNAVVSGYVDYFFCPVSSALPLIRDRRVLALAVSSPKRSPALPEVPTLAEAGVSNSEYVFWVGMFVPSATPKAVVQKLHAETMKVLARPDIKARFDRLGAEPMPMTTAEFDAFMKAEVADATRVARAAGLRRD